MASVACAAACSSSTNPSSGASGGGGTGGAASGGAGGDVTETCPDEPPPIRAWDEDRCFAPETLVCRYDVDCASGVRDLGFRCADGEFGKTVWQLLPEPCVEPYDHCHVEGSGDYYCDGTWETFIGSNPPAVCPETLPGDGDACPEDPFFGTSREFCGYRCPDGDWTIAECVGAPNEPGPSNFVVDGCEE